MYKKSARGVDGKMVSIWWCTVVPSVNDIPSQAEVLLHYVRSKEEQTRIVLACHTDPTSGHLGYRKTLTRVNDRFTWKGVVRDCQELVSIVSMLALLS